MSIAFIFSLSTTCSWSHAGHTITWAHYCSAAASEKCDCGMDQSERPSGQRTGKQTGRSDSSLRWGDTLLFLIYAAQKLNNRLHLLAEAFIAASRSANIKRSFSETADCGRAARV